MLFRLLFIIFLIGPLSVWAEEKCECELEGTNVGMAIRTLLEANYKITDKLAPLEGNAFHRSAEEIDALKVFHENEEMLKKDCNELYLKVKRRYRVFIRMVVGPDSSHKESITQSDLAQLPHHLYFKTYGHFEVYKRAVNALDEKCKPFISSDGLGIKTSVDLAEEEQRASCSSDFDSNIKKHGQDYARDELRPLLGQKSVEEAMVGLGIKFSDREKFIGLTALKALSDGDVQKYYSYLDSVKHKFTTTEKVQLVAMVGNTGSNFYDKDMEKRSSRFSFDDVTNGQIHSGLSVGIFEDPNIKNGICRHIASFQAATAEALGMEGLLVMSSRPEGLHTNVLLREKNGGSEAHLINPGTITYKKGEEGGVLLHQGNMDTSTFYLIGKGDPKKGKEATIAQITSEAAKVYTEALGNDIKVLEPMARTTTSLASAEVIIGGRPVALFMGQDGNGQRYVGAAAKVEWGNENFPGKAGVAVGIRKPGSEGTLVETYLDVQQGAKINTTIKVGGAQLTAQADALALLIGDVQHYFGGENAAPIGVGLPVAGANLGGEVKLEQPESGFSVKVRGETHARVGVSDASAINLGIFHNLSTVSSELSYKKNNHEAMARAVVLFDAFGPKALGQIGYGYKEFASQVEAGGRLRQDDATIREGSIQRVGLKVRQGVQVNDNLGLVLHFGASTPVEEGLDVKRTRFMGGLGGEF